MAGLFSVSDVIRLAQSIHQMCQDARTTRGALREAAVKLAVVTDILSELPAEAARQDALRQVYVVLQALNECVAKASQMKRFTYSRKAKDIANEIRNHTGNLQFYMNSLQVSQTAAVFRKLVEMDNALEAVEDEDSLRQQLEKERQQQKELNALLRNKEQVIDAAELQRLGWIESNDELQDLIHQMVLERDALVARHERDKAAVKDRVEADHLEQIINLLERTALVEEVTPTPTTTSVEIPPEVVESVTCPITSEIMTDPVIVDGIHCKCCVSREAFQAWQKAGTTNTCPHCRASLRSNRVSPNVGLAQVAAFVLTQQSSPSFMATNSTAVVSIPTPTSVVAPTSAPRPPLEETCHKQSRDSNTVLSQATESENQVAQGEDSSPQDQLPDNPKSVVESSASQADERPEAYNYTCQMILKGHMNKVTCCAVVNERLVVSGSADRTCRIWNVETGECHHTLRGQIGAVTSCASLPGGHQVITGSGRTVRLWAVETGESIQNFIGHTREVTCCAALGAGGKFVSGSHDKTLRIWSAATAECQQTLQGHTGVVRCCASLHGGRKVLSGSDDAKLRVWDVASGRCLQTLHGNVTSVRCCTDLDGERMVLSGSSSGTVMVWDIDSGVCLKTIKCHNNNFPSDIFAIPIKSGEQIVTGSRSKKLKFWNLDSAECLGTLEGHQGNLGCCVQVNRGEKLVSGSADWTLRVWAMKVD